MTKMNEEKRFETTINMLIAAAGAVTRLNIIKTIRSAERVFPQAMPTLKEWASGCGGALRVSVEDDGTEVVLEDDCEYPLTGSGCADGVRDWEVAVS